MASAETLHENNEALPTPRLLRTRGWAVVHRRGGQGHPRPLGRVCRLTTSLETPPIAAVC